MSSARMVLGILLAITLLVSTAGCGPASEPEVDSGAPSASEEATPEETETEDAPELDALAGELQDFSPRVSAASDTAMETGDFDPLYDLTYEMMEISRETIKLVRERPHHPLSEPMLNMVAMQWGVFDALIGHGEEDGAEARMLYLQLYPEGETAIEHRVWLESRGYTAP